MISFGFLAVQIVVASASRTNLTNVLRDELGMGDLNMPVRTLGGLNRWLDSVLSNSTDNDIDWQKHAENIKSVFLPLKVSFKPMETCDEL